jgi:hypothetical protein
MRITLIITAVILLALVTYARLMAEITQDPNRRAFRGPVMPPVAQVGPMAHGQPAWVNLK